MNTSSPSKSRLPGVVVRATVHAKIVASASARSVRGRAIRMVAKKTRNVSGSDSTLHQFSRVREPGCPGATSVRLP
jgi:hypothetical protein